MLGRGSPDGSLVSSSLHKSKLDRHVLCLQITVIVLVVLFDVLLICGLFVDILVKPFCAWTYNISVEITL